MLTIRTAQLIVFQDVIFEERLPGITRDVYDHLVAVRILPLDAFDRYQEAIMEDLRQARGFGIKRTDGLVQFASYRYSIGEKWYLQPEYHHVLSSGLDQAKKWSVICELLEQTP